MRIAIATCAEFPALFPDDLPIVAQLLRLGIAAEPTVWNAGVDWRGFSAVLIRSVWDYYLHAAEFRGWLDRIEASGVPCWNPPALVRWNLDKRYLRDLAAKGVPTPPTLWMEDADGLSPQERVDRILATGWRDLVLKPTVSAGAWRTLRVGREDVAAGTADVRNALAGGSLMVQPFLPEIVEEGEWSFLFFGGDFSHAVLKRPRPGDFRVQWIHGGSHACALPAPSILAQAKAVLAAAPAPGLYARVDGIVRDGTLVLMELEQIEPYLFLAEAEGSVKRFVDALRAS